MFTYPVVFVTYPTIYLLVKYTIGMTLKGVVSAHDVSLVPSRMQREAQQRGWGIWGASATLLALPSVHFCRFETTFNRSLSET
jgi:hypothetical protein